MAKQVIRVLRSKTTNNNLKGIFINKDSIGIAYVDGVRYAFNEDKLLTNKIEFDDAVNGVDTATAKKTIYIRRR